MENLANKPFSLVSTVFNEAKRLDQTIIDLQNQSLAPSEIVITDAGSTDSTYERLLRWKAESVIPIVILQKPKCNVAEGRNMAIKAAKYDLIASTDFGCRFDKDWLKTLMAPFNNPNVKISGGAFGVIEADIQTTASKAAYILSGGYNTDVTAPWFIPSSRSIAYYRSVFDEVGGYCEWLTLAADDLVFGKQFRKLGYSFSPVTHVGVFWGRHTKAVGYIKEAYRYGLGDGEARVNQRSFCSNLIETIIRYILFIITIINLVLIVGGHFVTILLVVNVLLLAGLRSYFGYTRNWLHLKSGKYGFKVFLYGFYLLEKTRCSYIKGYLKAWFFPTPLQKEQAQILKFKI